MNKFSLRVNNSVTIIPNIFMFSGGETSVNINTGKFPPSVSKIEIKATLLDGNDIMSLLLIKDAIKNMFQGISVILYLGYVPYARQDRVCNRGEAHSIKVFTQLINSMNFERVFITDPHSDVTPALINNCVMLTQEDIIRSSTKTYKYIADNNVVIAAPDAGASKKAMSVAKAFFAEFLECSKVRDVKTGNLLSFGVHGDVAGKTILLVDDICDGGGTFEGLAKELLSQGAKEVSLYVTHGIFSKGYKLEGITHIFTTNTLPQPEGKLTEVIKL